MYHQSVFYFSVSSMYHLCVYIVYFISVSSMYHLCMYIVYFIISLLSDIGFARLYDAAIEKSSNFPFILIYHINMRNGDLVSPYVYKLGGSSSRFTKWVIISFLHILNY